MVLGGVMVAANESVGEAVQELSYPRGPAMVTVGRFWAVVTGLVLIGAGIVEVA